MLGGLPGRRERLGPWATGTFSPAPPSLADYPIILRGTKGEIRDLHESALMALARREGWPIPIIRKVLSNSSALRVSSQKRTQSLHAFCMVQSRRELGLHDPILGGEAGY